MQHIMRKAIVAGLFISFVSTLTGCQKNAERKPAKFEPQRTQKEAQNRIARCNTVHTLTLPATVLDRYGIPAGDDTAVLSCSLQVATEPPTNIPARISAEIQSLSGPSEPLTFKQILDQGAVSYVAPFSIAGRLKINFSIQIVDPQSDQRFELHLTQAALPGRK